MAICVSVCSFGLASYQAWLTRSYQRLSVTPRLHLDFRRSDSDQNAEVYVLNDGVGPARLGALTVKLDGKPQTSWRLLLASIGAQTSELDFSVLRSGIFVRPGSEQLLMKITGSIGEKAFTKAFDRIEIAACYCSLFDECWRVQLPQYVTVDQPNGCPAPPHEMDE